MPPSSDSSSFSPDLRYRWWFERRWGPGPLLCWIGLNPGTGDRDGGRRPTLRKVVAWADAWGLEGVLVVNLFAWRATDPKALRAADGDIVGERNDEVIRSAVERSARTLAAWGDGGRLLGRGAAVTAMLQGTADLVCLGTTRHGEPRHPLYVPQDTEPVPYRRG